MQPINLFRSHDTRRHISAAYLRFSLSYVVIWVLRFFLVAPFLYVIWTRTTNGQQYSETKLINVREISHLEYAPHHTFEFILSAKFASQIFYWRTCGQIGAANGWAILHCWQRIRFTCYDRFSINSKLCACVTTNFPNFLRLNLWRRLLLFIFPMLFPRLFHTQGQVICFGCPLAISGPA